MNIKPSENIQLYGLEDYFHEISDLYIKKKCQTKLYYQVKRVVVNQL